MADIIVTYLSYGIFDTKLSTTVVPQIMTASAPSQIIRSTLDSSSSVRSFALKLLHSRKRSDLDIGRTLAEANKLFVLRSVDQFYFYAYVTTHLLFVANKAQTLSGTLACSSLLWRAQIFVLETACQATPWPPKASVQK